MNPTYEENLPRASCDVTRCHIYIVNDVSIQIDGVTHVGVTWTPYDDHGPSRLV